ncbi:glycosyl transferase [Rhodobacteraceae bacterium WD3A24]|nr:glycosyl transferase [Rhodobacteraceae bacterium WD3A24]
MSKIAFILLCHKDPDGIIAQAERLTAAGDCIAIHFDARAGAGPYRKLRAALDANPRVTFARRRVKCGWGEWSLVAATQEAARAALAAFPDATHLYMVSGDCMPIKPAAQAHALLDSDDADHIESVDFFGSGWIRTGMREERLVYRHLFNERAHKRLFYASLELQRRLGLRRAVPAGLEMMIGSQWWCLRRATVEAVLDFCACRPDIVRFFRTSWIPDETFFQTLVRHLVPGSEIRSRPPTFLIFSDYGMPVTFHDDHHDLLRAQEHLFARKISPDAALLRQRLDALWTARDTPSPAPVTGQGRNIYAYLTGRGRTGRRFAPRFWERGATIGAGRELLIVTSRKWQVGRRLAERIHAVTGLPRTGYLFSEQDADLPDLGGIGSDIAKRARHRRAMVRMIYDYHGSDRLVICVEPGHLDLIRDFATDRCTTRVLEVRCPFDDAYLLGHAQRAGLLTPHSPSAVVEALLPTLRDEMTHESDRLADAGLAHFHRIGPSAPLDANAAELRRFLSIPPDAARQIAATEQLYEE